MKQIPFLLFFLINILGYAQKITTSDEFKVSISDPYKVVDADEKFSFSNGGEIITVKIEKARVIIQKFTGSRLNCISEKTDEKFEKGFNLEELIQIDDKIYLFYSVWDKPNETEQLFKREISFAKGNFTEEGKRLFAVSKKITRVRSSESNLNLPESRSKFSFQQSNDNSHLVVRYRLKPEVKNDSKSFDIIGMYVFDKNIKELWHKELTMPYTESKMDNLGFSVDKDGKGYFLAKVYNGDRPKEKTDDDAPNYSIQLFKVDESGKLQTSTINVKNHFIDGISLFEDPKGYMVCAGYYKTTPKGGIDGVFMAKLSDKGEMQNLVSHEIPLEVINSFIGKRAQARNERKEEKGEADLDYLILKNYMPLPDGGFLLIGEVYYSVSTYNPQTRSYSTTYHYNDVIVTKVNPDGSLAWMQKAPKRQARTDGGGMSFSMGNRGKGGMSYKYVEGKDFHYILFLDNVKNEKLTLDKVPSGHRDGLGGYLTGYGINKQTGSLKRISIFDMRDLNGIEVYQFATNRIVSIDPRKFAVELYKKDKEDIMIKIELTE